MRDVGPRDGRALRVRLTGRGEQRVKEALDAVLAADERFLEPLGAGSGRRSPTG